MLVADLDLQVWLDTIPDAQPSIMTPYVQTEKDQDLQYRLTAIREGPTGSLRLAQGGEVHAPADQPTALSQFSITLGEGDQCSINLVLLTAGQAVGTYHFNCH